jgi:hypothetical protein
MLLEARLDQGGTRDGLDFGVVGEALAVVAAASEARGCRQLGHRCRDCSRCQQQDDATGWRRCVRSCEIKILSATACGVVWKDQGPAKLRARESEREMSGCESIC